MRGQGTSGFPPSPIKEGKMEIFAAWTRAYVYNVSELQVSSECRDHFTAVNRQSMSGLPGPPSSTPAFPRRPQSSVPVSFPLPWQCF